MRTKTGQILIHVIGCLAFLSLPVLSLHEDESIRSVFQGRGPLRDFVAYFFMIAFFYVDYYALIPRFYFRKKYLAYTLLIAACFLVVAFGPPLIIPGWHPPGPPPGMQMKEGHFPGPPRESYLFMHIGHNFFRFAVVAMFALILKINTRWRRTEQEKTTAELSYLKAQVNPHFLFNTLNTIYSLAIEKSDKTAPAVVQLSGMMRYVLSEADNDLVSLDKEIDYIRNYIDLQRIRFGDSIRIGFLVEGDTGGKKIAPLILITFVENAFKYGVNADENSEIRIKIAVHENMFRLDVFNNKVLVHNAAESGHGLGIENTRTRLDLLYPGSHVLHITDNKTDFSVSLELRLV